MGSCSIQRKGVVQGLLIGSVATLIGRIVHQPENERETETNGPLRCNTVAVQWEITALT